MSLSPRSCLAHLAIAGMLLAAGCGSSQSPAPGSPRSPATSEPPMSPNPSASIAPSAAPTPSSSSGAAGRPELAEAHVALRTVVDGLSDPLFATNAGDGSGRLFVVEQGGRIRVVRDGKLLDSPFLDLSDRVSSGGERGLLGLAFPPGFGSERETFYVDYTDTDGNTVVAEYRVANAGADTADAGSERVVLRQDQPFANHNGGWLGFDPGGRLIVSLGDGGSGGDPGNRASRLDTLLGKLLRIDVLGAPAGQAYAIPADNPFVGRDNALPEILDYGLRNPWRVSFDPATGDLWIGDVGQNAWEEVDVARAGATGLDFGWHRWEGNHCYDPSPGCDPAGVTKPVAEYAHALGCSITGGPVYRGQAISALRGAYLFSDFCSGTLWALDAGLDAPQAPITLLETGRSISAFGVDEAGEVYLTDLGGGELLELVPGA